MTIRFYAACLASYNAGKLHGRWIEASTNREVMAAEIAAMLAESPEPDAEEWAIHDYEGFPEAFGEYAGLDAVAAWAEVVEVAEDNGIPLDVAIQVANNYGEASGKGEFKETLEALTERGCGTYEDKADFAYQTINEVHDLDKLPDVITGHIDWDGVARDLEMDGYGFYRSAEDGNLYVFSDN